LQHVADGFTVLQQRRHDADYNPQITFTRARTREIVSLAGDAITAWRGLRRSPEADYFLLAMLLGRPRRS
jgi:hypothetical protein